jgi:hypothetical protein
MIKMGTIRKLRTTGTSKSLTMPVDWLKLQNARFGAPVKEFLITDATDYLTIIPLQPKAKEPTK